MTNKVTLLSMNTYITTDCAWVCILYSLRKILWVAMISCAIKMPY